MGLFEAHEALFLDQPGQDLGGEGNSEIPGRNSAIEVLGISQQEELEADFRQQLRKFQAHSRQELLYVYSKTLGSAKSIPDAFFAVWRGCPCFLQCISCTTSRSNEIPPVGLLQPFDQIVVGVRRKK